MCVCVLCCAVLCVCVCGVCMCVCVGACLCVCVSMIHTTGAGQSPQSLQPGAAAIQLREVQRVKGEPTVSD